MKVFISCSEQDHRLVHALRSALVESGIEPVLASQTLSPGTRLESKVRKLIDKSHCIVALLTPKGLASRWVQQEIGYAHACHKSVIPVKTKGGSLPGMLQGVEYILLVQSRPREAFDKVIRFLGQLAKKKGLRLNYSGSSVTDDMFQILHLPNPLLCPTCKHIDVHVSLCYHCGDWVCHRCGGTIPPTSRAK